MRTIRKILDSPEMYLVKLPKKEPEVFVEIYCKAGRLYETSKLQGIGHLLDHYLNGRILFRYQDKLETNAFIDQEHLKFTLKTSLRPFEKAIEKFFSSIFSPSFDDDRLLKFEAQALINEMVAEEAVIYNRIHQEAFRRIFNPGHIFSRSIYRERQVKKFNLDDLKKYHRRIFTADNVKIFVGAHALTNSQCLYLKKTLLKYCPRLGDGENTYPTPPFAEPKLLITERFPLSGQALVLLVFPGLSYEDKLEDRIAMNTLCRTLTGLSKDSIFADFRRLGIYSLDFSTYVYSKFGLIELHFLSFPDAVAQATQAVLGKLDSYRKTGIFQKTLNEHKKKIRLYSKRQRDDNGGYYSGAVSDLLLEDRLMTAFRYREVLKRIDGELVCRVAQKLFLSDQLNLIIFGSKKELDVAGIEQIFETWKDQQ